MRPRRPPEAARRRSVEGITARLRVRQPEPLPRHARLLREGGRRLPEAAGPSAPRRTRTERRVVPHLGRGGDRRRLLPEGSGRPRRHDRGRGGSAPGSPIRTLLRRLLHPSHDRGGVEAPTPSRRGVLVHAPVAGLPPPVARRRRGPGPGNGSHPNSSEELLPWGVAWTTIPLTGPARVVRGRWTGCW